MPGPRFYKAPEHYGHGTRHRYCLGCTCLPCTAANTAYGQARAQARAKGQGNGLVDATAARAYLQKLQSMGIGCRRAATLSGLPVSGIRALRDGTRLHLRMESARRILAIQPSLAHGQRVNSYRTRHLIACLVNEGYSKAHLAARLGLRSPRLHFQNETCRAGTALKVRGLFQFLSGEGQ